MQPDGVGLRVSIPQCRPVLVFDVAWNCRNSPRSGNSTEHPINMEVRKKSSGFPAIFPWTNPLKHCETRSTMSKKMESHERTHRKSKKQLYFHRTPKQKIHCICLLNTRGPPRRQRSVGRPPWPSTSSRWRWMERGAASDRVDKK